MEGGAKQHLRKSATRTNGRLFKRSHVHNRALRGHKNQTTLKRCSPPAPGTARSWPHHGSAMPIWFLADALALFKSPSGGGLTKMGSVTFWGPLDTSFLFAQIVGSRRPQKTSVFGPQAPRKGGFSKGGFCSTQCHTPGNKKSKDIGPSSTFSTQERHSQRGVHFAKPPSGNPLFFIPEGPKTLHYAKFRAQNATKTSAGNIPESLSNLFLRDNCRLLQRLLNNANIIDLLIGLFRGAVFRHGGGALKQPIKEPTETPTSTLALMGRLPSLKGRFPTLMGRFTDFVLRGRFTSWKSTGKRPIKKRGIKRFLITDATLREHKLAQSCETADQPATGIQKPRTLNSPSKSPKITLWNKTITHGST